MGQHSIDFLLTRMPEIATAVNAFSSETIQKQAFSALLSALSDDHPGLKRLAPESPLATEISQQLRLPEPQNDETGPAGIPSTQREAFAPAAGKLSFNDFIAWKRPSDNQSRFAVAVYWLKEHAGALTISSEDLRQLFGATKDWREPRNLNSALSVCASRKSTIDASKRSDIKLTPKGRHFVENELPRLTRKRARA